MSLFPSTGLANARPCRMIKAATQFARKLNVAARILITIDRTEFHRPRINHLVRDLFRISPVGLSFDHFDFHTTSTQAFTAAKIAMEDLGYELLLEREHGKAKQAVYVVKKYGLDFIPSVAITGPDPSKDYQGKPAVFLHHLGFVLKKDRFDKAFEKEETVTVGQIGDTPLNARLLQPDEISENDKARMSKYAAGKILMGLEHIEVYDQSPAKLFMELKAQQQKT